MDGLERPQLGGTAAAVVDRARFWLATPGTLAGASAGTLTAQAEATGEAVARLGLGGCVVALPLANDPAAVARLIGLLAAGASPLILPADAPPPEVRRLAEAAGAAAVAHDTGLEPLPGSPPVPEDAAAPGLLLCTSGSTGAAKVVRRAMASWQAEGGRYTALLGLRPGDHVAVGVPLAHAYAMGWLWGCILGGAAVELHPASALGAVASALRRRATHGVLTPTTAGLLAARRPPPGEAPHADHLRVAMAGAGVVTPAVSERFAAAFGVPLSTNYGSTETGAVLAALAPVPEGATGFAMPGVTARLGAAATLCITDETGQEHDMGDLAEALPDGSYRILGRAGDAVRRGDRWIAPREVAEVLAAAPGVADVHVRAAGSVTSGNQRLIATVAGAGGAPLRAAEVAAFAAAHLSPAKRPDVLEAAPDIPRAASGKPLRRARRRLAAPAVLAEAARAYKRSVLLFALLDSGLYDALADGATADEAAVACGLKPDAVERLLALAEACGLLEPADGPAAPRPFAPEALLGLERLLFEDLVTPRAVAEVLRLGVLERPFDTGAEPAADLRRRYAAAMDGPHRQAGRLLGLRALRQRPSVRQVLEVGASAGRYVAELLHRSPEARGVLLRLGRLAPDPAPEALALAAAGRLELVTADPRGGPGLESGFSAARRFDVVVCDNGIHGPYPGGDLGALVAAVAPGGALLIDDLFLPRGPEAALGLDWLTHGGCAHTDIDDAVRRLELTGGTVRRVLDRANGLQSVLLTTWTERTAP